MAEGQKLNSEHFKIKNMYAKETNTPATIVFYYDTATLLNDVSIRTLFRAKNIKNQEGEAQIEDYGLTNDEKDIFGIYLKSAIYNAFAVVVKMTTGISVDPVFVDSSTSINSTVTPNVSGFRILDNAAYNTNVLFGVDDGVFQYIRYSVLASWYEAVGLDKEAAIWETKKKLMRNDLITNRLFQLRKPLLS